MSENKPWSLPAVFKKTRLSGLISALIYSPLLLAAPNQGQVVSGNASISQSGSTTVINQTSDKAVINWQGFSVGKNESVNFNQPGASAVILNRVTGSDRSVIQGALNANGHVFLINPNGVLFSQGSRVNTGGLVAATQNISDNDFNHSRYTLNGQGNGNAEIINSGTIKVADGGYVVLSADKVINQGSIIASKGTVALAAGNKVTLNFNGNSLVNVAIDKGTLEALVANKQAIYADGGKVILTAKAADDILSAQVNNSGLIQAQTLDDLKGNIELKVQGGTTTVAGQLDASAPHKGDGGTIETSGAKVVIADNADISTLAVQGKTGEWLVDPDGFTVGQGGDISAQALSLQLEKNNIALESIKGSGSDGDLNINDAVTWNANTQLGLHATHNININAPVTAKGTHAGVKLKTDNGDYFFNNNAALTLPGAQSTLNINGDDYTLIHSISDFSLINDQPGFYALAQDLDDSGNTHTESLVPLLTGTLTGLGHQVNHLTFILPDGLLAPQGWLSRTPPKTAHGLIAVTNNNAVVRDIGVSNISLTGLDEAGALVGNATNTTFSHDWSTGQINAAINIGGLVGEMNESSISDSWSAVTLNGKSFRYHGAKTQGGLVGSARLSNISHSHATGDVSVINPKDSTGITAGLTSVGGLIGGAAGTIVDDCWASGNVVTSDNGSWLGGLIGEASSFTTNVNGSPVVYNGSITDSKATGNVSGGDIVGGLIGRADTAAGTHMQISNVSASGNVISNGDGSQAQGQAGGLIGKAEGSAGRGTFAASSVDIDNANASGNVSFSGKFGQSAGGLIGTANNTNIDHSSATGNVTGSTFGASAGALVGQAKSSSITHSQASGQANSGGKNPTTNQLIGGKPNSTVSVSQDSGWHDLAAEKAAADKAVADKALADKAAADKAIADKALAEKAAADKAIADKTLADKDAADKAVADKALANKSAADKAAADIADSRKKAIDHAVIQTQHVAAVIQHNNAQLSASYGADAIDIKQLKTTPSVDSAIVNNVHQRAYSAQIQRMDANGESWDIKHPKNKKHKKHEQAQ